MSRKYLVAFLLFSFAASSFAASSFSKKQVLPGKPEIFRSGDPIYFSQMLTHPELVVPQAAIGYLSMPKNIPAGRQVPAVIMINGSGGVEGWVSKYIYALNRLGIATFAVDSFTPRGVKNTLHAQYAVPAPMMVYDAFSALKFLSRFRAIDSSRIAVMGWSKGGWVSNITAFTDLQRAMMGPGGNKFAAHIMFYPACKMDFPDYHMDGSPWLYLHGAKDDYTRVSNCMKLIKKVREQGVHVTAIVYPNAWHDFDKPTQPFKYYPNTMNPKRCRAKLSKYWAITEEFTGIPLNTLGHYVEAYKRCATYGVHMGYNPVASRDAMKQLIKFVKKYLLSGKSNV